MELEELLDWALSVSDKRSRLDNDNLLVPTNYLAYGQIAHATSELGEVFDAIRLDEGALRTAEECWDAIFSTMSIMNHANLPKAVIMKAFALTKKKVDKRLKKLGRK